MKFDSKRTRASYNWQKLSVLVCTETGSALELNWTQPTIFYHFHHIENRMEPDLNHTVPVFLQCKCTTLKVWIIEWWIRPFSARNKTSAEGQWLLNLWTAIYTELDSYTIPNMQQYACDLRTSVSIQFSKITRRI